MSAHIITVQTDTESSEFFSRSHKYFWTCSCGLSARNNFMATAFAETNGNHHARPENPWSRVGGIVRKIA